MLKQRLISAFIGAIFVILILFSSEAVVSTAIALVTVIGLTEMYKCLGYFKDNKMLAVIGYTFSALYMCLNLVFKVKLFLNFQAVAYIMVLFVYMVLTHNKTSFAKAAQSFMATMYITVCFIHIVFIRREVAGFFLIWLVFLTAWMTDTFAYIGGMLFGKHKLIPKISPNKTVEGAVSGVVGCILSSLAFAYIIGMLFGKHKLIPNVSPKKSVEGAIGGVIGCVVINVIISAIVAKNTGLYVNYINLVIMLILASIVSQFGDLAASCIKRDENIKDFGNIMPGHGGILDRCDSVLFVAPFMCYFVNLFVVFC